MTARAAAAHTASQADKGPRENKHGPCGSQFDSGQRSSEQNHGKGAKDDADEKGQPPGQFLTGAPEQSSQNAADAGHSTVQKDKQGRRAANQEAAGKSRNRREIFDFKSLPLCVSDTPGQLSGYLRSAASDRFGSIPRHFSPNRVRTGGTETR